MKKNYCKLSVFLAFTLLNIGIAMPTNKIQITSPDKVRVSGDLEHRMRLAVGALDNASRNDIWSGFRSELTSGHSEGMWCADWPGRTLEAYSRTAMSLGEMATPRYDEVAWGLIAHQEKDGVFHNGMPTGEDEELMASTMANKINGFWFGNARGLLGYIWADNYQGEKSNFKQPSVELANYFTEKFFAEGKPQASPFLWCATEALTEIYRKTNDQKYLATAVKIGKEIPTLGPESSMHTHSYILSLRGVVRACQDMGNSDECKDLMNTVMASHDYIVEHVMWPGGGIVEHLSTKEHYIPCYWYDENCSVCDWLGLNLDLWVTTLKTEYIDMAERVALNHLLFDQDASGGFCGDRGVDFVREGSPWPFCCSMHGTRTLSELTQYIAMTNGKEVYVNLFYPSNTQLTVNGKALQVNLETNYPNDGKLKLTLKPSESMEFPLKVRVPAWSSVKSASVNSTKLSKTVESGYITIEKKWKEGDVVELVLDMPLRTEKRNAFYGNDASVDMNRVSLWKGPRQLVYNQALNNHLWEAQDVRPGLRYVYQTYEELQFDKSVMGTAMKIKDKTYEKGLGVHTVSEIVYSLDGQFKEFISDIGVDASAGDAGAVRFKVCVDGIVKSGEVVKAGMTKDNDDMVETLYGFQVAAMTSKDEARTIRVDVENAKVLRLCVDDGVNGLRNDYGNWADARLVKSDGTVVYLSDMPDDRRQGLPLDWGFIKLENVTDSGQAENVTSLKYTINGQTVPIRFNYLGDLGYSLIQNRPVLSSWMNVEK